ncbi:MAG: DUF5017 domain-containing protein [Bacteroidaceae bacterium]|nr:DUF5017 domain-containing protein [Bacteroidaceae bacterium]
MKKIYQLLLVAVAVIGITTSCSDVPAPYEVNPGANGGGKTLPYKSTALSTGWTMHCISANEPWSQGSSYTQATGYQDWGGTGAKSNAEVESYLISPPFNTASESGKVRFYFDNTIRYTNNVSGWVNYEKIFVSSNYDGKNFDAASWEQIAWTPTASPFSDWTLYSSGQIQLPEAYVNQDSVYIAFYFYAPSNASTTWELENFVIEEGEAGDTPAPSPTEGSGSGTATDPYNATAAVAFASALAADVNSDPVYITGIICNDPNIDTGQYGNATFYISDDGTDANRFYVFRTLDIGNQKFTDAKKLKKGDKVVIYGPLVNYRGNTPETVGNKTYLISINGSSEGGNDTPDNPDTPGSSEGVSISGTTVTLTNSEATAGSESIKIDFSTLGLDNAAEMGTVTLSDGTTIAFDKGSNSNAPKYYSATKGARVYANNIITFNGKSKIAKIVMTCDSYNGVDYVGNATATVSFSGNNATYVNASSDAGTQLRVQTITITYAE